MSYNSKRQAWLQEPILLNEKVGFWNCFIVIVSAVLFLTTLIGGYNFLTEVMIVLSFIEAVIILCQIFFKNKLNIWRLTCYTIDIVGVALAYIIRGADGFWWRTGYNIALSILGVVCLTILFCIPRFKNHKAGFYTARVTTIGLVISSVIYGLFMNIRMNPTVDDLKQGEKEYLSKIDKLDKVKDEDPNIILILMDDMAFSDISSYSYLGEEEATIKTPNIDQIGKDGIMMDSCYAAAPVSSPSRFSILTGRYSSRGYLDNVVFNTKQQHCPFSKTRYFNAWELDHNVDGLLGDEITSAEVLKAHGYKTGLFGKWNLGDYGEYLPTNQGFDYFFGSHYINDMIPYNVVEEENGVFKEVYSHNDMLDQSLSTERFTESLLTYMDKTVKNKDKFFLEYASPWPHFPIFSNKNGNGIGDKTDDCYIDCIEEFDNSIGEIRSYLKNTEDPHNPGHSLDENTLIMFTSDNGPGREGVTGNLRGRKNTPFEGAYKVPFVACFGDKLKTRTPDENGNRLIKSRCINMDVFTTCLDYAGIHDSNGKILLPNDRIIDGVSMRGLWENPSIKEDVVMHDKLIYLKRRRAEAISMPFEVDVKVYKLDENGKPLLDKNGEKIVDKTVKEVHDFKFYKHVQTENSAFFNQFYNNYLFDLDADPAEGYNVAMHYPEIVKEMEENLNQFRDELKHNRRGIIDK